MANLVFNSYKKHAIQGDILYLTDTIKVALMTAGYGPNRDAQEFWSDISGSEITGTGYTTGGATLTSKTVTQDNTNDLAYADAADSTWATSTLTARYAVIYKSTGTASTSPLICVIDFVTDRTSSTDTFYIQWAANGIFQIL